MKKQDIFSSTQCIKKSWAEACYFGVEVTDAVIVAPVAVSVIVDQVATVPAMFIPTTERFENRIFSVNASIKKYLELLAS